MFAVAVAAAVAYSSWVLEWFLPGGVDPLRSYASELAAVAEAEKSAVLVHSLCSSTAAVGMALVGAGPWLLARDRAGRMLAGVFVALLAMVAVTSRLHEVGGPNLWLGLWQRLSLSVAAVVIVTVAVAVTSAGSTARREAS